MIVPACLPKGLLIFHSKVCTFSRWNYYPSIRWMRSNLRVVFLHWNFLKFLSKVTARYWSLSSSFIRIICCHVFIWLRKGNFLWIKLFITKRLYSNESAQNANPHLFKLRIMPNCEALSLRKENVSFCLTNNNNIVRQ